MTRRVTLVVVGAGGRVLGALPSFEVDPPWWSEVDSVVAGARGAFGVEVVVLRLLDARPPGDPAQMGGDATYAVELRDSAARLDPVDARFAVLATTDDPLRLLYARPGGPARELAWAESVLASHDRPPTGPARQLRTWNLSSIWCIPTVAGPAWLKSVPPFFAHEGAVIDRLAERALPPLVGFEPGRVLLDDVPGVDHYDADPVTLERAVTTLVGIQDRVADRVDELFALGLPDWRWPALRALAVDVVGRHGGELAPGERDALDALLADFDARTAGIDACGLPITLVHGDFHPGNLRGDPADPTLLDWGDCGIGHPLLDHPAMLDAVTSGPRAPLREHWAGEWKARRPGCDPDRAAERIRPIAALRQAVIYRGFLDRIEPSERIYHAADPARWLRLAAADT